MTVVVDNANLKFNIYVNGELGDSKTMNEALYFPANLQNGGDGPAWFHVAAYGVSALIDEVHAFNTALSAAEVAQAYKDPSAIASLTGYYTFDEESDTEGYFDNLAENALANSSAVYWAWSTNNINWISGSNTATSATLVPGREIAPAEVKYSFAVPTAEQLGLEEITFLTEDDDILEGGQSYEFVEGSEISFMATSSAAYIIAGVTVNGVAAEIQEQGDGSMVYGRFAVNANIDSNSIVFDLQEKEAEKPSITYRSLSTDGSVRYFSELAYTVGEETKVIYHTDDATQEDYYVAPTNGKWSEEGVYIDFTDKVLEVPANAGDFTMIIKSTISGQWAKWNQTAVFVDWNNNGQFNDAGETNGVLDLSAKPNNQITTAAGQSDVIALPEGIQPGTYTILIITNEPKGYDCTGDMWEKNWEWTEGIFNDGVCSVANGHAYALTLKVTEAPAAPTYALTIQQPENAVITVKNGEEAAENGAKFEAGTQLTLEAACEAGYNLVNFTLDGQPLEGNTVTVPEADFTVSATVAAIDYCESTETTSRSGRGITSIDVNGVTINGNGSSGTRSVFVDRTETVVTARAGETLNFTSEGTGSWMHTFIYIDYNQNGWDFEPEATSLHGDLVWFQQLCPESLLKSHTTPSSQNKETIYDMEGNNVGEAEYPYGGVNATVTIPADLAPGDYRVRYKLDWASANPCGNPTQLMGTNGSSDNGGTMIDFTLRVEAAAQGSTVNVAVAEGQESMGTVSIEGAEGSSIVTNQEITIVAQPNTTLDAAFLNWTKNGEVVSTDARYTFTPDADVDLVANFGWVVTFSAVQTDGFMSVKNGEQAITSGSAFAPGTVLTVIVVANDGKKVESVTARGTEIELTDGQGTFTVDGFTQIFANFVDVPTYSFTATVTGNGRVEIWNNRDESTDEPKGNRTLPGGKLIEGEEANIYFFPGVVSGDKYETVVAFDLTDTGESYTLEDLDYYKVICHYNNNYTMYPFLVSGDIDIKVTFSNELAGIADILFDGIEGETEYYDLNGVRVDAENIQNGVYILRRGNVTKKVYIRK